MELLYRVLGTVAAGVVVMHVVTSLVVVGPTRLRDLAGSYRSRVRAAAPSLAVLGAALVVNSVLRELGPTISWVVGVNVTGLIMAVEGAFVASLQSVASPALTAYFSFAYVYGYVFLLTFPLLAYLALPEPRAVRELAVAYVANYVIGLACYLLVIAYGPRNVMPGLVEPLLYSTYPSTHLLTTQVNVNTNVFPSLHTSMSVTVALLAWRSRRAYPRWLPVAGVLAASVVVATMYLGIHWATDVVAGIVLAAVSVRLAGRYAGVFEGVSLRGLVPWRGDPG